MNDPLLTTRFEVIIHDHRETHKVWVWATSHSEAALTAAEMHPPEQGVQALGGRRYKTYTITREIEVKELTNEDPPT